MEDDDKEEKSDTKQIGKNAELNVSDHFSVLEIKTTF